MKDRQKKNISLTYILAFVLDFFGLLNFKLILTQEAPGSLGFIHSPRLLVASDVPDLNLVRNATMETATLPLFSPPPTQLTRAVINPHHFSLPLFSSPPQSHPLLESNLEQVDDFQVHQDVQSASKQHYGGWLYLRVHSRSPPWPRRRHAGLIRDASNRLHGKL